MAEVPREAARGTFRLIRWTRTTVFTVREETKINGQSAFPTRGKNSSLLNGPPLLPWQIFTKE
jgi:hypothetical protein